MIPLVYETTSRILSLNSMHYLGRLTGCTECTVEESRNADYTLSASVVKNSECAESAVVQNYIYAKPNPADEPQFFEIYEVVEKTMCLVSKRSTSNITAITTFLPQAKHQHNSIHLRRLTKI